MNPVRSLTYDDARARVLAAVRPVDSEVVSLEDALGRVLVAPIVARHDLPSFPNASMDGIAARSADLVGATAAAPVTLPVVETLPAGHVASRALGAGEAMRIMTGAMVPAGADTVVPVEELERLPGERVGVRRRAGPGENVRPAGLDLRAGEIAVPKGRALTPHDLALLAALGEPRLDVSRRPLAVVLSTGDELLEIRDALRPGAIRDSNRLQLSALLEESGVRVERSARLGDDPDGVADAVTAALETADVVLTIGGVSAGDFDPVKQALERIGEVELWRVAMKPGRPQAFGTPRGRLFFGLPGNPASVACVFEALVRPALRRLQGHAAPDRPRLPVRASATIPSRAGRTDFVRVTLALVDGGWWATPAGDQVSGHLTPQSRAHALLVVPEPLEALPQGAAAEALVLRWPEPPAA